MRPKEGGQIRSDVVGAATDGHAPVASSAQPSDSGKARVVLAGAQAVSKPATAKKGRREMSQMRDATPSNRSRATLPHSQGSSLASLVVTVGVTCSWPLEATEHGARGTEDLLVSNLGQHRGGIVIAVGQDEYDAIDAADQVTPELITSQRAGLGRVWRRSVSQSICNQSGSPSAADRVFPVVWLVPFGFRALEVYSKHPRASCPPAARRAKAKKKGGIVARGPKLAEQCVGDPSSWTGRAACAPVTSRLEGWRDRGHGVHDAGTLTVQSDGAHCAFHCKRTNHHSPSCCIVQCLNSKARD